MKPTRGAFGSTSSPSSRCSAALHAALPRAPSHTVDPSARSTTPFSEVPTSKCAGMWGSVAGFHSSTSMPLTMPRSLPDIPLRKPRSTSLPKFPTDRSTLSMPHPSSFVCTSLAYDGDTSTAALDVARPALRKFMLSPPSLHRHRSAGNHSVFSSGKPKDRYRSGATMPRWNRLWTIVTHDARAMAAAAPSVPHSRRGFSVHSALAWYLAARKRGTSEACQSLATNTGAVSKYARFIRSVPASPPPKKRSSHGTASNDSIAAIDRSAKRKSLSWYGFPGLPPYIRPPPPRSSAGCATKR
mmetsp:Transcript_8462/g.37379  ORF Transcript_8462/g.37379 Transcript_8462/m.37379 type:complete len:299 (-) Transcript_8462:909-1805(-)